METRGLQKAVVEFVARWDEKRKATPSEALTFAHIVEEVGELAREYVNKESRPDRYSEKEIENAIGDLFMQVVKLAHLRGLDIEDVVLEIIKDEEKSLEQ